MSVSKILSGAIVCLLFSVSGQAAKKCELVWVPKQFASIFSRYRDSRYLPPVTEVNFDKLKKTAMGLEHYSIDFSSSSEDQLAGHLSVTAEVYYNAKDKTLLIEELEVSPEFGTEYAHRLFFSYIFDKLRGDVSSVRMHLRLLDGTIDKQIAHEQLARGKSKKAAIKKLPLARTLADFGFTKLGPKNEIYFLNENEQSHPSDFGCNIHLQKP